MSYQNKTVIISGAANGIGASIAKSFFEKGANVALLDIVQDSSILNQEKWYYQSCNVAKEQNVKDAIENIYKKFGRIDFLINNAGIQRYGSVTESTSDEWDEVMNVNLKSLFLCSKYVIPYMQLNPDGVVINMSSVQAFVSQQKVAAYTTSKTAILGLTRSIAVDFAPSIRCIAVCPGTIDTPMLRQAISLSPDPEEILQECIDMHLPKRIGTSEEVAELVLFLCSNKATFINGTAIRIDGGLGITIAGSKKEE